VLQLERADGREPVDTHHRGAPADIQAGTVRSRLKPLDSPPSRGSQLVPLSPDQSERGTAWGAVPDRE
jgi:hypothetical protein